MIHDSRLAEYLTSLAKSNNCEWLQSGKKITEGIATTHVTESLGASANTALSRDFG